MFLCASDIRCQLITIGLVTCLVLLSSVIDLGDDGGIQRGGRRRVGD